MLSYYREEIGKRGSVVTGRARTLAVARWPRLVTPPRPRTIVAALLAFVLVTWGVDLARPTHAHAAIVTLPSMEFSEGLGFFTVPSYITQLHFDVRGASGLAGQSSGAYCCTHGGSGGLGGQISATVIMGHGIKAGDKLVLVSGRSGYSDPRSFPLAGGNGGAGLSAAGGYGGYGGGGSGVYDQTSGQWLLVAGGGGGGGGIGGFGGSGGNGGVADAPGQSVPFGVGGATGQNCPESGVASADLVGRSGENAGPERSNGGGGGGGGGCYAGEGGRAGDIGSAGGGGAGGRSWNFAQAHDVQRADAPLGNGSISLVVYVYTEPKPQIISPSRFDFTVGQRVAADFVSVGTPPPELLISGTFPRGVTFTTPFASGQGLIRGVPEPGSAGVYTLTITARNDFGSVTQVLTLAVQP